MAASSCGEAGPGEVLAPSVPLEVLRGLLDSGAWERSEPLRAFLTLLVQELVLRGWSAQSGLP